MDIYTENYERLRQRLENRRAAVIGLGKSNIPLIRFLHGLGCAVTACDKKTREELGKALDPLAGLPVTYSLGQDYLQGVAGCDYLFVTPGMPKDLPEIKAAIDAGAKLDSEMGLFFSLCRAPIIGITGSIGKTTTTTITGEILRAAGRTVHVGGNIGHPLLSEAEHITPDDIVVLELSSFQLQMLERSPQISVVLNIIPNHLDQHRSMEEYIEAKKNIFRFQRAGDYTILNLANPVTAAMAAEAPGNILRLGGEQAVERGVFVRDGAIIYRNAGTEEAVCTLAEIKLPGRHNVEDIMAAVAATKLVGVSSDAIRQVVRTFAGIEHRLEFVRELAGVKYYNDSKATTPQSTMAAIGAFEAPVVLIAGGYDKHVPFDEMAEAIVASPIKTLILIGVTAGQIRQAVARAAERAGRGPAVQQQATFAEAVTAAQAAAAPGDIVLLSPACASYDMFPNFEVRGTEFKRMVNALQ